MRILAIFDIEKDDLLRLASSETLLEELIARLAEAEVVANGHSPAFVRWSGSTKASDGGVDIQVQVPGKTLKPGFLQRPYTVLQSKVNEMPASKITGEMTSSPSNEPSPIISELAKEHGSYIIVSLKDDCSPNMYRDRLNAMKNAVQTDPNAENIHLDFYDRSKLAQWIRQHPSVLLWVKEKIGQGYSGWKPYGAWSNPPRDADDTLILADGVSITLPSGRKHGIADAIDPIRKLIHSTSKAVRVTGLSGVGKTRIVQALFDETIGTEPLDRTIVIYVDTGENPNPSATAMLDRLIAENRKAVMVLDNCPSELHTALASKVYSCNGEVRLITVEYDIRDDKPQTTEVIHIETVGIELAGKLLLRRFPNIGQVNAKRIAEFADGNARVALAIGERVGDGESLAKLSDDSIFNRLFEQKKGSDSQLKEHGEILSLVYSFSVSQDEGGKDELEILASIADCARRKFLRAVSQLSERHVIQQRSHWRAVLPHAIANRLASCALDSFSPDELREFFENCGSERLLMSFAHRLGLLHDHPVAEEIASFWLSSGGMLGDLLELDGREERILAYIAPIAPDSVLGRIESELTAKNFVIPESAYHSCRYTILNLLRLIAYDAVYFERCTSMLLQLSDTEGGNNNHNSARNIIVCFFQAYLSGTHASLQQRVSLINECLSSTLQSRKSLGLKMLSESLKGQFSRFGSNEFGARPRNYGFWPTNNEFLEWCSEFVGIAVRLGTSSDKVLQDGARVALANAFSWLWEHSALRIKLIEAARLLNAHSNWSQGLQAIRSKNYFARKNTETNGINETSNELAALERELEPEDLISRVRTYVFPSRHDVWGLDPEFDNSADKYEKSRIRLALRARRLGVEFADSAIQLNVLGTELFHFGDMSLIAEFGKGLASKSRNVERIWTQLLDCLWLSKEARGYAIFAGVIEEVGSKDMESARTLLAQCAQHPDLQKVLVGLHPTTPFNEGDLKLCMSVIEIPGVNLRMYEPILWRKEFSHLSESSVYELANKLLEIPHGEDVVLVALWMKLDRKDENSDSLGLELRLIGLKAAIQRLKRDDSDLGGSLDHSVEEVISAALRFDGNEKEKLEWLDTILDVAENKYGYISGFETAIETTIALMPMEFLDRVFDAPAEQHELRRSFLQHGGVDRSPLAKVDVNNLIEWCLSRDDDVWASIAFGLKLWAKSSKGESISISEAAIQFLEAAPDPVGVLEVFSVGVTPSSWVGSRADAMQPRVDAFGRLAQHQRIDIATSAGVIFERLLKRIAEIRKEEQQRHENNEQRFE